ATTPLTPIAERTEVPLLRRRVPPFVFWTITITLIVALLGGVAWLQARRSAETPTGQITLEQLALQQAKRRELTAARSFAAAHNYNEAIGRYNAYLAKSPNSPAAIKEREEARRNLILPIPSDKTITVTKPQENEETAQQPQPPSRWERFKRWWR